MVRTDPYTPEGSQYECVTCGYRTTRTDGFAGTCPECQSEMKNIAVPRE